jgi:diaminohydroxyphosphoribosylaminopyrimidine deaminase / 5-amino-6-(5-phosphoribosylamino)uracil reductase
MHRCLELALLGAGHTAPNPMVGSVLVYEDRHTGEERIIGEGYHEQYGQKHAEANCIAAVKAEDRPLIAQSTLYVSLEPCAHYGKQPPCADLIIEMRIPRVVVGCRDPFPQVNGTGIEKLQAAGVEVRIGVLEKECIEVNKRFLTFNTLNRPYIVLKWAQSADGKIAAGAGGTGENGNGGDAGAGGNAATARTMISNDYTNRLVHKWRAEEAAILVGTRTALLDDPALTVRLWNGPDPIRLVIDKELQLPLTLKVFDGKSRTVVFNGLKHEEKDNLLYYQLATDSSLIHQLIMALTQLKILSVLVEGGARLLQSFIDEGYWDEARIVTNNELEIPGGLAAPVLREGKLMGRETLVSDTVRYYKHES